MVTTGKKKSKCEIVNERRPIAIGHVNDLGDQKTKFHNKKIKIV